MIKKAKAPSKYEKRASRLLRVMKIEFRAVFIFHGPFWEGDKESRNVWELILTRPAVDRRNTKTFSFRFGQSIADSFRDQWEGYNPQPWQANRPRKSRSDMIPTQRNIPTSYDLLACITKNDPGTFSDFCGDMGLDTDSRKAEKTYFAVQEEWEKVRAFFSAREIRAIQEVQ
jgi:hypothetical protein